MSSPNYLSLICIAILLIFLCLNWRKIFPYYGPEIRFKFSQTWSGNDFVAVKYSINGKGWTTIGRPEQDPIWKNWYKTSKYYRVNESLNLNDFYIKFPTVDSLLKMENDLWDDISKLNKKEREYNERKEEILNKLLKK